MQDTGMVMTESVVGSGRGRPQRAGPAVVCRGVTKEFGQGETRVRALRGIDVELPCG